MEDHPQSNVEADESDLSIDGRDVLSDSITGSIDEGLVESDSNTDDGNDELANEHTKSTINEKRSSSNAFHGPEGEGSSADVDQVEDEGDEESVADSTGRLQEGSRIVEDEVDTSPLLHHLQRCAQDCLT